MRPITKALAAVKLTAVILWAAVWYGAPSDPHPVRRPS